MAAAQHHIGNLIEELKGIGPIKIWSLLVTFFGDQAGNPDTPLTGGELNEFFAHIGIKPEALRVALHRLGKDNWIKAKRVGRTSEYYLTEYGLSETRSVHSRVYGRDNSDLSEWLLVCLPKSAGDNQNLGLKLTGNTHLVLAKNCKGMEEVLKAPLDAETVPDWVLETFLSDEMRHVAEGLCDLLAVEHLKNYADWSDLDRLSVRILALHNWRRLALRDASWLHKTCRKEGLIDRCQRCVHNVLAREV